MSIELEVKIVTAVPLTDVLGYARRLIPQLSPCVVEGVPSAVGVVLEPFALPERAQDDLRRRTITSWPVDHLYIASGRIAKVRLYIWYIASDAELGLNHERLMEPQQRLEHDELTGYHAEIDMGVYRTHASFCLGATLACAIATLNRSRIIDDSNEFGHGQFVDPAVVAGLLAKHGDAPCFEELADRFCAEVNFAPNWPDWRTELATAELEAWP